uniref:28S ribosomal protein S18c, mitochondrial n=1 Tax=Syphacia muris TaxID=451379 RepID=A0A0N5AY94_9BILA
MLVRLLSKYSKVGFRKSSSGVAANDVAKVGGDLPVSDMCNPYVKEAPKCFLCANKIDLDYKNARLLQQFVSSFSGRVYDRHITGLCDHQQKKLLHAITLSRKAGYMPVFVKDPRYLKDPKLFDPLKPIRPHSYA